MISTFSTSYTLLIGDNWNLIYNKKCLKQELHSKESIVSLVSLPRLSCLGRSKHMANKCLPQ